MFLGSDGRDDLYLDDIATGKKTVNADENLFLRTVEQAEGHLDRVLERIKQSGQIMDDLSLLKISFFGISEKSPKHESNRGKIAKILRNITTHIKAGNTDKAESMLRNIDPVEINNANHLKMLTKISIRSNLMELAARFANKHIEMLPLDSRMLYAAFLLQIRLRRLESAANLGERLLLRGLKERKLVQHLSEVYKLLGNTERSEHLLSRIGGPMAMNRAAS